MKHTFFLRIFFVIAFGLYLPVIASAQVKTNSVAENMLLHQRVSGGWPKAINGEKVNYTQTLSEERKKSIRNGVSHEDATFDNAATTKEIKYLVNAYRETQNGAYLEAAQKGIDFILKAQYANGGWPQYYPAKNLYRGQITFNDNAMINVLNLLQDIVEKENGFEVVDPKYIPEAKKAVAQGITCILNTQVKVNGTLTAWAAQYDEKTLLPAKARAFEPASLSSSESVGVVRFLMRQPHPSAAIKTAVVSAVTWLDLVKIEGYTTKDIKDASQPEGKDRILVKDPHAVTWARFYDLNTFKPIFIGRDAVIRNSLAEIENERRVGYAWYGAWAKNLLEKEFPKWKKTNG